MLACPDSILERHQELPRTAGRLLRDAVCAPAGSAYTVVPNASKRVRGKGPGQRHMSESAANVTQLLRAAASGERRDLDALMAAIYDDLHRLAVGHMRGERDAHTLQPTALVHEAYLKLIDQRTTEWADRVHFFAVASRLIRRILVDHARERCAAKRGGGAERMAIEQVDLAAPVQGLDLVALDEALTELHALDERQAKIVEMRFFGGLTLEEIAEALAMGRRSVDRDWRAAKAWLAFRLDADGGETRHG